MKPQSPLSNKEPKESKMKGKKAIQGYDLPEEIWNTDSVLKQVHYGLIAVDNLEKDVIQIWMFDGDHSVIQIERENIGRFIELLQKLQKDYDETKRGEWRKKK